MGFVVYDSVFGPLRVEWSQGKITRIQIVDSSVNQGADFSGNRGEASELSDNAYAQLLEYFEGKRRIFDFPFELHGTDFQKKVWEELCRIPYGETRTYKEIAEAIGNPNASRAVGMANNRNPILIAVPCHRVIGAGGALVGYAGGLGMKERLLEMEEKFA